MISKRWMKLLVTLTDDKQRVIALQPISQKEDATRLCIETCIARNWRLVDANA
ncbi:7-carboxy-7-deazaguanine synthase [Leclercia adecarboxylata]|uniref:7-carboxy-7-deazaguanine synthase n=1 Tax=Leclercia adecarboxylata TaxID=83655 RepID=A0A4V6YY76_9ENTR|nr:7-carboxy-7-deazaguanine synthase [Leclercia adecarboxylata]